MILPILKLIRFIEDALNTCLCQLLSKPQLNNFIWLTSAIILGQRFNLSHIQGLLLKRKSINAFSWFMSHSKLNLEGIWQAILLHAIKTFNSTGCLGRFIVDDTIAKNSKFCRFIEGACTLFDHATGAYAKGKCFVFLYFAVNDKVQFPIGWKIYIPNQKTKYTLALELIDEALAKGFQCLYVLVDSWFAIAPFLDVLAKKSCCTYVN